MRVPDRVKLDPMIVAVVQMTSRDEVTTNLARAEALVRRARERGALLVVLPENLAYMGPEEGKLALAERFERGLVGDDSGPIARWASTLARETDTWLVLGGVPERVEGDPSRVYNASVVFDAQGRIVAGYRKIHLFDVDLADGTSLRESRSVTPGRGVEVIGTPVGVLGLSICYDLRFPELYRAMVDRSATILSVPAAFTVTTGRDHWHVLLRARAIESQCYVLAAAQWGSHGNNRTTYGHALICDPWGTIVAECPDGEGFALAEIDHERVSSVRAQLPSLKHRRLR